MRSGTTRSLGRSAQRLNPLRSFREPLTVGLVLDLVGFVAAWPPAAAAGGALLIVLSARVAYDHRGAGRYSLPISGPMWRSFTAPAWWRRQVTGAILFYVAVWLIVG